MQLGNLGVNGRKITFISLTEPARSKVYGCLAAKTMVQVLKQCGDDLTRENVMRQATDLKDVESGLLLPGIKINTSAQNYFHISKCS